MSSNANIWWIRMSSFELGVVAPKFFEPRINDERGYSRVVDR